MEMKTRTGLMEVRSSTRRATFTAPIHLNELYDFKDDLVKNFLEANPSLVILLFNAHGAIRKHFGNVKMILEVVADPEALGDQQLFVLIRTELPRRTAREHLADLDREWWLNALPAAEGKLEIALE